MKALNWQRWLPILNTFDEYGVDVCYEIHQVKIYDGATFERLLMKSVPSALQHPFRPGDHLHLQQIDYLAYIDIYHERIKAFHVKDAGTNINEDAAVVYTAVINLGYSGPGRFLLVMVRLISNQSLTL